MPAAPPLGARLEWLRLLGVEDLPARPRHDPPRAGPGPAVRAQSPLEPVASTERARATGQAGLFSGGEPAVDPPRRRSPSQRDASSTSPFASARAPEAHDAA